MKIKDKRGAYFLIASISLIFLILIAAFFLRSPLLDSKNFCQNSTNDQNLTNSSCAGSKLTTWKDRQDKVGKIDFAPRCNEGWRPQIIEEGWENNPSSLPEKYYCLPDCKSISGYEILIYPCNNTSLGLRDENCQYDAPLIWVESHPLIGSGYIYCNNWPENYTNETKRILELKNKLTQDPDNAWDILAENNCSIVSFNFVTTRSYNASEYYECALKTEITAEEWNIGAREEITIKQNAAKYRIQTNCSNEYSVDKESLNYDLAYECVLK